MPVGTSGGLPEFWFFIKSTPDALPKAEFSQMAGLGGLLLFRVLMMRIRFWFIKFQGSKLRLLFLDFYFIFSAKGKIKFKNQKKISPLRRFNLKNQKKLLVKEKINFKN